MKINPSVTNTHFLADYNTDLVEEEYIVADCDGKALSGTPNLELIEKSLSAHAHSGLVLACRHNGWWRVYKPSPFPKLVDNPQVQTVYIRTF